MLVDSHCHLDYLTSPQGGMDLGTILQSAAAAGVGGMLTVAVDRGNIAAVLAHARAHAQVYASVGVHPSSCAGDAIRVEELLALAAEPKVVAIGETGLDYHYTPGTAELQRHSFVNHLEAASRARLPVIVHSRDASEDTLRLLEEHADREHAGVMHCFTESLATARAAMAMNFLISFSGIITFRNAAALREVVREVPLERMLVETDAPYLAPVPHRGRTNEPCRVVHVAQAVAAIKQVPLAEVARVTTENFFRLFPRAAAA
jgi:TatD DNase family protein